MFYHFSCFKINVKGLLIISFPTLPRVLTAERLLFSHWKWCHVKKTFIFIHKLLHSSTDVFWWFSIIFHFAGNEIGTQFQKNKMFLPVKMPCLLEKCILNQRIHLIDTIYFGIYSYCTEIRVKGFLIIFFPVVQRVLTAKKQNASVSENDMFKQKLTFIHKTFTFQHSCVKMSFNIFFILLIRKLEFNIWC